MSDARPSGALNSNSSELVASLCSMCPQRSTGPVPVLASLAQR